MRCHVPRLIPIRIAARFGIGSNREKEAENACSEQITLPALNAWLELLEIIFFFSEWTWRTKLIFLPFVCREDKRAPNNSNKNHEKWHRHINSNNRDGQKSSQIKRIEYLIHVLLRFFFSIFPSVAHSSCLCSFHSFGLQYNLLLIH